MPCNLRHLRVDQSPFPLSAHDGRRCSEIFACLLWWSDPYFSGHSADWLGIVGMMSSRAGGDWVRFIIHMFRELCCVGARGQPLRSSAGSLDTLNKGGSA